ncbi:rod shape-determining protein RodA [Oceanicella actignis]|uniref:Peptidoglycan glycosyltransferase MrdB n=1 Tax=Oceanicella actignis TaxID=1189325 RepID=A0A1M7S913_9RHOB|nr:rod shape-determining protein RodA [Oceanicella actignis]TYO91647.1 rod shape determining protein RodA [Oceanicella actignis]SET32301.1 cell elongation-specific peptidoglycan biosynthesis regulator RodA [Oceanicella actignis]SHN54782.1 rod shape determining protein RodA [Oceanicella actignis]
MTFRDLDRDEPATLGAKLLRFNWALLLLVTAVACVGFLMLYSVAGGRLEPWSARQMVRFAMGVALMMAIAMIHVRFWRAMAPLAYLGGLALLAAVELFGSVGMGAQRWIDLGFVQLQPSEAMKIALVMALARYYDWLDRDKVSRPLWLLPPLAMIALPMALVLKQPDLGTALLLGAGGAVVMFLAGVSWWYFIAAAAAGAGAVAAVMASRGTEWQLLKDYQYRRIEVFLDPSSDPLGAGYHITQSKIAFGSGGLTGRGFMQGTQARLNFLPEKHTDFIFTTLAEEFGHVGSLALLGLYALIVLFCTASMLSNRDRFGALMTGGLTATFFFFFAVNMAMVMGLAPVVGVPLPLVSYGGSAMLVLMIAFGLIQSAHVHRPRRGL